MARRSRPAPEGTTVQGLHGVRPARGAGPAPDLAHERRPYRPYGRALDLIRSTDAEVLISGPAGTGKSRACLEKLHLLAEQVAGFRGLILRRTRASLTTTALVTWEQHVVPEGHPCLSGPQREGRSVYRYPNGSEIAVGGLDKPGRVMSSEWDAVYVQEATELTEEGWEALTTRLRNNKAPYQQLLADCNPDSPRHWLKRRCDAGRTRLLESRHEENPLWWNGRAWTPLGLAYIAKLDALTGHRKLRLRHGRWAQSEGVVYEGWDAAVHLINRFDIPQSWPRILSIDFGYSNPFVCQWWALDGDDRFYLYREIYLTRRLVEDHARRILQLVLEDGVYPVAVVCDHDAEGRATLERHLGLPTTPALKPIKAGIQGVAGRLKRSGDGRPRLFVLRDSLDEVDRDLEDAKRPTSTTAEFDCYIMDPKRDLPVDRDNHGMDAMRYAVWTLDAGQATGDQQDAFYRA